MEDDIKKAELNNLYGGGYYTITKVQQYKDNKYMFSDIFLLTESIENKQHLEQFKKATEDYNAWLNPKKGKAGVIGVVSKDKTFL